MQVLYGGFTSSAEFIDGAQKDFYHSYCLRIPKTLIFMMLLATIPSSMVIT
jgi:phospholipid/cholesterol/gamma-HCH transport system permease protein